MGDANRFELGERVAFSRTLSRVKRVVPDNEKNKGDVVKRWEYVESPWLPKPVDRIGVIVGVRVLSNGHVDYDGDGYSHYTGVHHFTAYAIAYDLRRAHVLVKPEDIQHLDRTELF